MASVQQKAFGEVLKSCLAIDRMAVGAYETLGKIPGLSPIHPFCSEMSREERDHVAGWERLLELHRQGDSPRHADNCVFIQTRKQPYSVATLLATLIPRYAVSKISAWRGYTQPPNRLNCTWMAR